MKKLLIFFIVCLVVQSVTSNNVNRLSSDQQTKNILNVGEQIISTLGYYKAVLEQSFCQLKIYQFNEQQEKYDAVDLYKNNLISSCKSIKIDKNQILTDQGKIFAQLPQSNFIKTYLTINDVGIIKFIGIKSNIVSSTTSNTEEIILFSLPQSKIKYQNIKSYDEIKLNQLSLAYVNDKLWLFKFENNQLTISKLNNPTLSSKFNLQKVTLNKSGYYAVNEKSYPFVFSQNAFLQPRCDLRKTGCQVRPPYTIEMNKYWPVVRIFDQQKYLVAEYSLLKSSSVVPASICPSGSFLYKDSCLKQCPFSFYEHISGNVGQCVLVCPEGSIIDKLLKRCSCSQKDLLDNQEDTKKVKKCQKDWNSTFFGCDCSSVNLFYDRVNTLSCQSSCPEETLSDNGVCYECPSNCKNCSRDKNNIYFAQCDSCISGFRLQNGRCIKQQNNCTFNCDECNQNQCVKCSNFYSLHQGKCLTSCPAGFAETQNLENGSFCIDNSITPKKPCPVGCLQCKEEICFSCAVGYIMFVSPLATTCKIKNQNTKCPQKYTYQPKRQICYYSDIEGMKMGQCKQKIIHCQICKPGNEQTCVVCQQGYFLYNNQCVQRCPSGSSRINNFCVDQIQNCQFHTSKVNEREGNINFDLMKSSTSYKRQIYNGLQPGNDPRGYEIYMKQFVLKESTNNVSYLTTARSSEIICSKCRKGYGLSDNQTQCLPCPSSCDSGYCYFARQNSCYKPTIRCTYLDQNGQCMESCPQGRYPQSDQKNVLKCLPYSVSTVNDYLKIDSSYYLQGDGTKIYYFVLDKPVQNGSSALSARLLFSTNSVHHPNLEDDQRDQIMSSNRRVLVSTQDVLLLQKGQYYSVRNTQQNAVAISFEQKINQFRTPFGFTLANTIYGAQADYTHSQWMKQWLAHIGYVMSWIILLVHCIYVGNTILYKVDNLIIFAQTVYFFTFVKLLVGNTLAQYYYGWFWMHMGFFPNYFKYTVPIQYDETQAPLPYKLATLDGNFIRNAGYAISLFITFLVAWTVLCLSVYLINKILRKSDIWYQGIAKNSLIAATELLSMVVFFFSVSQLLYDDVYPQSGSGFRQSNIGASIFFICIISIYTLVRVYFNPIGGLYMFKRIAIALILVAAYSREGFLALLIALQVCIGLVRYVLQKPRLLREKLFMLAQCACFVIAYILLFLVTVPGVNVLIITIIIFVLLLFLIADLMDVYMEARNELYEFDFLGAKYDNQSHHEEQVPQSQRKMNTQ